MPIIWNYWDKGYEHMPQLIKEIYDHNKEVCSKHKCELILITVQDVREYIPNILPVFFEIAPNFQSDYVRFNLLYLYGGMWLDSDALIYDDPNKLHQKLIDAKKEIFATKTNKTEYCECAVIAVTRKLLPALYFCVQYINDVLANKPTKMGWGEIGPETITKTYIRFKEHFFILNDNHETNPINFITWETNEKNINSWVKETSQESKEVAIKISDHGYPVILTWRLYQLPDENVKQMVLNDPKSIFYNLIH